MKVHSLPGPVRPASAGRDRAKAQAAVGDTQILVSAAVVAAIGVATAAGQVSLTLVDVLVVLGVALVLPMALPGEWWWSVAAAAVIVSLHQPVGATASVLVLPWIATSITALWHNLREPVTRHPDLHRLATVVAAGYSLVAAGAFASSRLGLSLFGIGEPIIELTAVHYTYAGTAAVVLAGGFLRTTAGSLRRIAVAATALTACAPIVVAMGFVTHHPLPQVGGAVLMTLGVWLTATLELHATFDPARTALSRILTGVSGAAIWIPMVLAVAWASGQHWDVPALSIPDMERTHGVLNALAFVGCGLLARHREKLGPVLTPLRRGCCRGGGS